jgi:predicted RND superfamily exporter protein
MSAPGHPKLQTPSWLIRILVILGLAALTATTALLLGQTIPFEIQSLLSRGHPVRVQYEKDQELFNDEANAWLVVEKSSAMSALEIEATSKLIGRFLEMSTGVESYVGPNNAKFPELDKDGLHLTPFLENGDWTPKAHEKLSSELWRGNLVREDYKAFLMSFRFSKDLPRKGEKPLVDRISAFLRSIENERPEYTTALMGAKVASAAFFGEMQFQMRVITPLLLIAIGVFLWFCYRSIQVLLWNYFVMFICYASTLCLIVACEGGLGPYSSFALMFAFIVATTDLIHFFSRYQQLQGERYERLRETVRIARIPCLLTSLTTAAGFLALIVNQNLPIRFFGAYCAFGCLLEWVVIFYLLPPILLAFNFDSGDFRFETKPLSKLLSKVLHTRAKALAAVSLALIILGGAFSFNLKVDDNFYTKFNASHPLSRAIDVFSRNFQFIGSIDLLIKPMKDNSFAESSLTLVRDIEHEIEASPHVSRVSSFRQISDDIDQELNRDPNASSSPEKKADLRRAILNLFNDYGVIRGAFNQTSGEFRTEVFLKSLATKDFNETLEIIAKLKEKYAGQLEVRTSGFTVLRAFINSRVIQDFFESFFLSFLLIFICYLWLYRSFKWAALALVPNAIPLLSVSGLMGLFGIPVDTNLVILICVAFGISGDNTVHLSYVLKQNQAKGQNYEEALKCAMSLIGVAMTATSGIFVFCLPVFLLGNLKLFTHIAIFLSVAFAMAFIADVFMFPAFQIRWGWSYAEDLSEKNIANATDLSD